MTKRFQNLLPVFILLFGLLILFSMFFDVMQTSNGDGVMTGVTATFGGTPYQISGFFDHTVTFSYLNLLAFGLPALISILFVASVINNKKTSPSKFIFGVLLTLAFALSIVLFFQLPENTTHVTTILGNKISGNYGSTELGIGSILGYIFAILGAVTSLIYAVLQFER